MIKRKYIKLMSKRLARYPAVALIGPRQSGKTTLAKSLGGIYFDLEQEQGRVNLEFQWNDIIQGQKLIILDEAQENPEIFKRLRGTIDADRKRTGRFLLLGSVSPYLMRHVSESLAGRMALVELTPFLWSELSSAGQKNLWFYGGYPKGGILDKRDYPQWQKNYLELLTARDLPNWGLPAKPKLTQRLLKMIAVLHGQTLNASRVGQSLDISYKTVNSYLDYLEGAFLIRRLYPYHANLKKRLIKSPKIYWRDNGLLNSLFNVNDEKELLNQPWVGAAWEGFIIEQTIGRLRLSDKNFESYYLRTSDGYEIDLVLDFGKECWAVEIKLAASPGISDLERLNKTADFIKADKRILVSKTTNNLDDGKMLSCNIKYLLEKALTA
jgi:predicted AAA+ superfamily ATPase